jgi:hypothetical protein
MPHGLTRGNFEVGRIEIAGWAGFSASQFGEENVALLGRVLNATQAGWWLSSNRLGFVSAPKLAKAQSKNQTKHGEWGLKSPPNRQSLAIRQGLLKLPKIGVDGTRYGNNSENRAGFACGSNE